MALSLYYKSPSTYKCIRKNGIILPGETIVKRWLNSISFSTPYMDQIRLKIPGMSENEKNCTILLDEVVIINFFYYQMKLRTPSWNQLVFVLFRNMEQYFLITFFKHLFHPTVYFLQTCGGEPSLNPR